jgi:hypothetical protein
MQNDSLLRMKRPGRLVTKIFEPAKSLFADNFTVFSNALSSYPYNATDSEWFQEFLSACLWMRSIRQYFLQPECLTLFHKADRS